MPNSWLWDTGDGLPVSEESKWKAIRTYRNELLTRSDWTQVNDSPLSDEKQVLWMEYRQSLRDITANFSSPDDVIFPEPP